MQSRILKLSLHAIILIVALSIGMLYSCEDKDDNLTTPTIPELEFSEWKLTKFVNVLNQTFKTPEPEDIDCYFLRFELNNRIFIRSSVNNISGDYVINTENSYFKFENLVGTEIAEVYDGNLFVECINNISNYSISNNTLKLYYNNYQYYLEFEKRIPITN
ncbi:MAG: META domain-containing protein [Bacteroidales bacterium]|nr:META domain-containing protein [Bacteroidales bacterium]